MGEKKLMNWEETWDYIERDYFKKESVKVDSLKSIYASWKQEIVELEEKHNRCEDELFFAAIDELNEQLAELKKSAEEKKLAETLHEINKAYIGTLFAFADENGMDREATTEIAYYLDSGFEWGGTDIADKEKDNSKEQGSKSRAVGVENTFTAFSFCKWCELDS